MWREPFSQNKLRERTETYICARRIHDDCCTEFDDRKTKSAITKRGEHWSKHREDAVNSNDNGLEQATTLIYVEADIDAIFITEKDGDWWEVAPERVAAICVIGETKQRIKPRKSVHSKAKKSKILRNSDHGGQRAITLLATFKKKQPSLGASSSLKRKGISVASLLMPPRKKARVVSKDKALLLQLSPLSKVLRARLSNLIGDVACRFVVCRSIVSFVIHLCE